MAKLFGFSIENADEQSLPQTAVSPVPPNQEDANDNYLSSGFFADLIS